MITPALRPIANLSQQLSNEYILIIYNHVEGGWIIKVHVHVCSSRVSCVKALELETCPANTQ